MSGTVTFSVPAVPAEVGPVVEVRDHNLRHVLQAQPGAPIALDAGLYLASVVLPSGETEQVPVEVTAGEAIEVDFPVTDLGRALASDLPGQRAHSWHARFLWADDGLPVEGIALDDDLTCTAPDQGRDSLICMQVNGFTCMLPILPGTSARRCRVRIVERPVRATALPIGDTLTASVARYVATGHLRQAAHAVANAGSRLDDPVGAALGAYALLRLGRVDEIGDWVEELTSALPDGAVIAAERAARAGQSPDRWIEEALQRGVPMFSDGLSLLATRLRPRYTPGDARAERILDLATRADCSQVVVAYPGGA